MKDAPIMATTKTETRFEKTGFVPGAAHLALDVADRTQSTAIAVLQDARGELRAVIEGGIELAEKTAASVFRLARKATARIDEGVAETLTSTERLLGGGIKSVRETTRAATDVAHTAVTGLTGPTAIA
jgi:hypothetical protein